jgi:inosine-uridine nucleoside N-ribohydrolase
VSGPAVVCDPGIDDLFALMTLVGAGRPPVSVTATAGNAELPVTSRNAAAIMSLLGLDGGVGEGSSRALDGPYPQVDEAFHGDGGLGGLALAEPAVAPPSYPAATGGPTPGPIAGDVLVTSPLTPVAEALRGEHAITSVTWMGGAWEVDGNMTAAAEFNAWLDPLAADEVLRSGLPVRVVPLDVTDEVVWSPAELAALAGHGRRAALAVRAGEFLHRWGPVRLPDAVAAVAYLEPGLFRWREAPARCDAGRGPTRGMTSAVATGPVVRVATGADAAGVRARIAAALAALP